VEENAEHSYLQIERNGNLAVGFGLGQIRFLQLSIEFFVVIDLSVGSNDNLTVSAEKRLFTRLRVDDGKTLMRNGVTTRHMIAAPIGTSVSQAKGTLNELLTQLMIGKGGSEDGKDTAHDSDWIIKDIL